MYSQCAVVFTALIVLDARVRPLDFIRRTDHGLVFSRSSTTMVTRRCRMSCVTRKMQLTPGEPVLKRRVIQISLRKYFLLIV